MSQHGRRARSRGRRHTFVPALAFLAVLLVGGFLFLMGSGGSAHAPVTAPSKTAGPAPKPKPKVCSVSATLVPSCGAWWGMYIPEPASGSLYSAVTAEDSFLGRPLDIVEEYYDMSTGSNGIFPPPGANQLARHHLLMFNWNATVWSQHRRYSFSRVASGALDSSVILPEAERLKAFHHTVFLTLMAEADGSGGSEGTPAQFIAAWQHVHDVFARAGVRNVVWVWTVEGWRDHHPVISALYPGSAYVNWVGYDPYNFYSCHASHWTTFADTVEPFYEWSATQVFANKPLMLTEFGTDSDPADPALETAWYHSIDTTVAGLPRLKALVEWNSSLATCNLRITNGSGSAQAYRQAGLAPYFSEDKL